MPENTSKRKPHPSIGPRPKTVGTWNNKWFSATTESVKPQERFKYWNEINQPSFSMKPVEGEAADLNATLECWRAGRVSVGKICFLPVDRQRVSIDIGHNDTEILTVRAYTTSDQTGLLGDDVVSFASGDVHIYPFGQELRSVTSQLEELVAFIPYSVVEYDPATSPKHIFLQADTPAARLMTAALCSAVNELNDHRSIDAAVVGEAVAGMVRGILDQSRPRDGSRTLFEQARGTALRSFIRQNIRDSDLDVQKVCQAFGASRATVFREFKDEGGVASYILRQRLHRARLDLVASDGRRGTVGDIAHRYAFSDTAAFSRAFRRQFNMSPLELVGQRHHGNENSQPHCGSRDIVALPRFYDWVRGI